MALLSLNGVKTNMNIYFLFTEGRDSKFINSRLKIPFFKIRFSCRGKSGGWGRYFNEAVNGLN